MFLNQQTAVASATSTFEEEEEVVSADFSHRGHSDSLKPGVTDVTNTVLRSGVPVPGPSVVYAGVWPYWHLEIQQRH